MNLPVFKRSGSEDKSEIQSYLFVEKEAFLEDVL